MPHHSPEHRSADTEVLGGTEVMRDGDFQGERIHDTLLTDQDFEARES